MEYKFKGPAIEAVQYDEKEDICEDTSEVAQFIKMSYVCSKKDGLVTMYFNNHWPIRFRHGDYICRNIGEKGIGVLSKEVFERSYELVGDK